MSYCHALIVDDDAFSMQFLSELMQEMNFKVTKADSARKALEHLREKKIDIVISDLVMPEMDGLKLLEKIKEVDDEIPFVMVTGYPSVSGAVASMKSGASGYLTKPYTPDELKRCLSEAVKNKALANGHAAAKGILVGLSISIIIWSLIVGGIVSIFST
jgi:DNA-binding NtrC family response regulator